MERTLKKHNFSSDFVSLIMPMKTAYDVWCMLFELLERLFTLVIHALGGWNIWA